MALLPGGGGRLSTESLALTRAPLSITEKKSLSARALATRGSNCPLGPPTSPDQRSPASSTLNPAGFPASASALTDPEQEINGCHYAPLPPPPHPEPFLEFPQHPESSMRINASPERHAAATLLLNSKANPSLNSFKNKHHPIW